MRRLFIPLLCKLLLLACGPARAPVREPPRRWAPDSQVEEARRPATLRVDELVVTPERVRSVGELLAEAHLAWAGGDAETAAEGFDAVVALGPQTGIAAEAGYWAALAWERAGRHDLAAQRFESVARRHPQHALAADAMLRSTRLWGYLDRWGKAGTLAAYAMSHFERWTPTEKVALHSTLVLSKLQAENLEGAEYHLAKGRRIAERVGLDQLDVIPRDVAQLYFALGEWRRLQGAQVTFDPLPADFAAQFERRAQWLLDAQGAYLDVMRARDAHWSAMAGFRIGELYHQLHRDVSRTPRPPGIPEERFPLFQAAMKLRYLVLLEKGLTMYERTLRLAQRTGEVSPWVERAFEQKARLEAVLARERAAIDAAPYRQDDLRSILGQIQARQ